MYRSVFTILFSGLLAVLFSTYAFADSAPLCGIGGGGTHWEDPCVDNQYHLNKDSCVNFCQNSEYCKLYQDENKTVFGGFWRAVEYYDSPAYSCKIACNYEKEKCESNDQDCLSRFMPEDIDCSQLTDVDDKRWCNENCIDSILTSECGRTCLKDGIKHAFDYKDIDGSPHFRTILGCEEDSVAHYCSNLCTESYCASIPLQYETKWSVFGALLTLFTVFTGIILFMINRRRKTEDKD